MALQHKPSADQGASGQEMWLVLGRKVYDLRSFCQRHPGGSWILISHLGEDVTDAFEAFHVNKSLAKKYLNPLLIGELAPDQSSLGASKNESLIMDFRELCITLKKMGLLKPNTYFFMAVLLHILLLDAACWLSFLYFGTSLLPFAVYAVLCTMSHIQALWFQHDLGHLSIFQKPKWNHLLHKFVMCHLLGASANWWTLMHSQHHAKPNCHSKDPDTDTHPALFALGKTLSVELGVKKTKFMPYNHQHKYFTYTLPPLLFPTFFQYHTFYFAFNKNYWVDIACMLSFLIRFFIVYGCFLEIKSFLIFFFLIRMLESSVSQMNHIPMTVSIFIKM